MKTFGYEIYIGIGDNDEVLTFGYVQGRTQTSAIKKVMQEHKELIKGIDEFQIHIRKEDN